MNQQINSISGRLSLRKPQRDSLEILGRVTEILSLKKDEDITASLEIIQSEYPFVTDFEREFPSFCFALATGVGKTRLMGAFITYLHLVYNIRNFFVLAPNLTIYDKLIKDFTPNTPKYVFKGISNFAITHPTIITGDNFEDIAGSLFESLERCRINVFNISKINSEVRGGKAPRIKQLSEYIGQSYFEYLASLPDLVLLMDESHRYRATAGVRAINELRPILGLELTATPFTEGAKGPVPFKNVIYNYSLAKAMADGFVKEPAVVTRKDFNTTGMSSEEIEDIKLNDGVSLHESIKVDLETYALETNNKIVKPFVLIIARDTTHAGQLLQKIQSPNFFEGRYGDKVIQVDSSTKEEEVVERLLKVEHTDEPTEIVIHVNMLKEGWDVTNLYTIIPLRAANARTLIEQSIGRGLRLPYGRRTGVASVDRLNIIAHDRFQEIVDEARSSKSPLQLTSLELDFDSMKKRTATVVSESHIAHQLNTNPTKTVGSSLTENNDYFKLEEKSLAQITYDVIKTYENKPTVVPTLDFLSKPEIQSAIATAVRERHIPNDQSAVAEPNIEYIVEKTTKLIRSQSIDIPQILVVPKGNVQTGFHPFTLDMSSLHHAPVPEELWIQTLRTGKAEVLAFAKNDSGDNSLEDFIVNALTEYDDVSYEEQASLLYELAGQAVHYFLSYLTDSEARKVIHTYVSAISKTIHTQMLIHAWEDSASGYEVKITKGFSELKPSVYTAFLDASVLDYKNAPPDKGVISKYIFNGFDHCLFNLQKFESDSERVLAIIIDRNSSKWFRPAKGQFQIYYKRDGEHAQYVPDFVVETSDAVYMLEVKKSTELDDKDVLMKKEAAETWCKNATDYLISNNGKRWEYVTIPHDVISENKTLDGIVKQYGSVSLK